MSLFKAYKLLNTRSRGVILEEFKAIIDEIMEDSDNVKPTSLTKLVCLYSEYSTSYLSEVVMTFQEPRDANATMKFMNSYIAEVTNKVNLHYFNAQQGFSIIDKSVQAALDNGGIVTFEAVQAIIKEIEDSYIEENEEEE
tara:strand:- start:1112 stop:1531 length:420 start_codon:yes stop_codon:yes gene_type:complete